MQIIPENGAENKRTLTTVPYFDVTSPVIITSADVVKWRAMDAYQEFLRLKREAARKKTEDLNTRAFNTALSIKKLMDNEGRFEVEIHSDMVRVKSYALPYQGTSSNGSSGAGEKRGAVAGFSRKSRKRLIELMASTRFDGEMVFMTLTYPDSYPKDPEAWISHFEALRRRLERMSDKVSIIWRKELKERKSGRFKGCIVPHYHMVALIHDGFDKASLLMPDGTQVLNNPDVILNPDNRRVHSELSALIEGWALAHWSEIVASGDDRHKKHGVHCAPVKSKRHAYSYASKYLAKEEHDDFEVGRRWGIIGKFDTSAFMRIRLERSEYVEFRRLVSRLMKSRGSKFWKRFRRMSPDYGCTVFGLGDETCKVWNDGFESTVLKILLRVTGHY